MTTRTANDAYMAHRREIDEKISALKVALADFDDDQQDYTQNWAFVGSVAEVNQQLSQMLEFLGA